MGEKPNTYCVICNKPYFVCVSCADKMKLAPYKKYTDTSEHYKVFQIIRAFNNGMITKTDAKRKLNTVDISDIDSFKEEVKADIQKIMGAKTVNALTKTKVEKITIVEPKVEEVKTVVEQNIVTDVNTEVEDVVETKVEETEVEQKKSIVRRIVDFCFKKKI